jgi:hypothetical protein
MRGNPPAETGRPDLVIMTRLRLGGKDLNPRNNSPARLDLHRQAVAVIDSSTISLKRLEKVRRSG